MIIIFACLFLKTVSTIILRFFYILESMHLFLFLKQSSINWAFDCPINFQNKVSQTKTQLHEYSTVGIVIHKFCSTKPVGLLGGPMAPRKMECQPSCGFELFFPRDLH